MSNSVNSRPGLFTNLTEKVIGKLERLVDYFFIGGSIFNQADDIECLGRPILTLQQKDMCTPFGIPPSKIYIYEINEQIVAVTNRHGKGHVYAPHQVNYRAIINAAKQILARDANGITTGRNIGISAAGTLDESIVQPKSFVIPDQMIDWTHGQRISSFFYESNGLVVHIPAGDPFCSRTIDHVAKALAKIDPVNHPIHTRVNSKNDKCQAIVINGLRFSTRAESILFKSIPFDCIAVCMTPYPENILSIESGICYITILIISDVDAGKSEDESVDVKKVHAGCAWVSDILGQIIQTIVGTPFSTLTNCNCRTQVTKSIQTSLNTISGNLTLENLWNNVTGLRLENP